MNWQRVRALLRKDWLDLKGNRMVVLSTATLPTMFLLNFLVTSLAMEGSSKPASQLGAEIPAELAHFGPRYAVVNQMNDMGIMMMMLTPAVLPMLIGAFSIVGEKKLKSLEPLLASPLTTGELLLAKALGAMAVPLALGWLSYALFVAGLAAFSSSPVVAAWVLRPASLTAMLLLTPLLSLLATLITVVASSRTQDPRAAQAWAMVIAFPLMGLAMSVLGGVVINMKIIGTTVGLVAVACLIMHRLAIALFRREVILTRWK